MKSGLKIALGAAGLAIAGTLTWIALQKPAVVRRVFTTPKKEKPVRDTVIKTLSSNADEEELARFSINPDSVYTGLVYVVNGVIESDQSQLKINDLVQVELIDNQQFRKQRKRSFNALKKDTSLITYVNGNLHIDCPNGKSIEFKENDGSKNEWDESHYSFDGVFEKLNRIMVHFRGNEWTNKYLVDRNTCIITDTLDNRPYFSQDFSSMLVLNPDPIENTIDVQNFTIGSAQEPVLKTDLILNYMLSPEDAFLGEDGWFYVHSRKSWNNGVKDFNLDEYVRLRFK